MRQTKRTESQRLNRLRELSDAWEREAISPPPPLANKESDHDVLADIRRIHREFNARIWAAPIYWLEALPRARWWVWLRKNIAMIVATLRSRKPMPTRIWWLWFRQISELIMAILFVIGSLWGSWYLWKWFVRALLAE